MYGAILTIHLVICVLLVAVVLVQSSKGGLVQGAFGGATQTVFGGRGANDFITWATIVLGSAFFITSLSLALITSRSGTQTQRSLVQEQARRTQTQAPPTTPTQQAAPGGVTPAPAAPGGTPPAPAGSPR